MAALKNVGHEKFCLFYVATGSRTEAVKFAGYSQKNIHVTAYKIYSRADVQKRITELTLGGVPMLSFNECQAHLYGLFVLAKEAGEFNTAINAIKEINKMNGYVDGMKGTPIETEPYDGIENVEWEEIHSSIIASSASDNERFEKMLLGGEKEAIAKSNGKSES